MSILSSELQFLGIFEEDNSTAYAVDHKRYFHTTMIFVFGDA